VPYEQGAFEFVLPTVVLPRYVPPDPQNTPPDAARISATPLLPEEHRDGHTLSISVTLDAGKLTSITSPSHELAVSQQRHTATVTLRQAESIPNKDFVLRYAVAGQQFETAAFSYRPAGQPGTALLMLTPAANLAPEDILPRELLFVFDRSGSMGGDSIVQARNALHACLRALNPGDRFNIFPFNNRVEQFSPVALDFTQENVNRADAYISQIEAGGGTEIRGAIKTALEQPRDSEYLRVVVFMTDGAVGNEDQVLRELRPMLNEARVYAFGIGSAVNRFLLDKLAEVGRGTVEYIFPGQAIEDAVQRFQNRAAFPVLVDVQLDWGDNRVTDAYPDPLPDLYAGQPLSVLARFHGSGTSRVRLSGRTPRGSYEQVLEVEWPQVTPDRSAAWSVLAQMWARARIDALMTSERDNPQRKSQVRDEIIGLALEHHLLSPYTAFVAVEQEHHPERAQAQQVVVPIHLPQGTRREAFEPPAPDPSGLRMMLASGTLPASAPQARGAGFADQFLQRLSPRAHKRSAAGGAPERMRGIVAYSSPAEEAAAAPAPVVSHEQRYTAALRYLARTQGVSGAWAESPVATALVLLAFLRRRHTDSAGNFRPQLTRAVRWLSVQAHTPHAAPVVAWALAHLANTTGTPAHAQARDAALAAAAPASALMSSLVALAQAAAGQQPGQQPALPAMPTINEQTLTSEHALLELAIILWEDAGTEAAQAAANALSHYQEMHGNASGAVIPPGHSASQPDSVVVAATAAAALAWG
jgi:Ca-activated chloride channel family protein